MAHPSTPLFLIAAVAFGAPDVLATPVQGLRGAISNSTGEASLFAKSNRSASSDDVEPANGAPACCRRNDADNCDWKDNEPEGFVCVDLKEGIGGCYRPGPFPECCTPKDVGHYWILGGCIGD